MNEMVKSERKNEIVVYQPNESLRLDVSVENDTVWLTQGQMVELFQRDQSVIARHIRNAFKEGEVDRKSNMHFLHNAISDKPVQCYDLEVIISVGYRVKSLRGTQFRRWATQVLKDHLLKGYSFNVRMNQLEDRVDRRLASHEKRLAAVEQGVDFVVRSALPAPEMVFFEGEFLAAHVAIRKIVKIAKRRLILIDNYIDERVLTLLAERRAGVACRIYGKNANKRDIQLAFSRFQQQYPNDQLQLTQWNAAHDRFIICDDTLWLCGSSVKDAGRRTSMLIKLATSPDLILSTLPTTP